MNLIDAIKSVRLFQKPEVLTPFTTRWGNSLDPEQVLTEYPRPQMKRDSYISLNGYWQYAITKHPELPTTFDGFILVPFSPEASLSGVNRQLQPDEYLWYQREWKINRQTGRCLLHFGAVDQNAIIYINRQEVARHEGGYLPFCVDITEYIDEMILIQVRVQDASDTSYESKGKQRLKRGGMYYTAQSGIWQSVWIEWVSEVYIDHVSIDSDIDQQCIQVAVTCSKESKESVSYEVSLHGTRLVEQTGSHLITIPIPHPQLWTPKTPTLYDLKVKVGEDEVVCYFAMRCFSVETEEDGIPRICLNHQPYYMNGVLDQGYWPDGLLTAPSDEAMIYDIMKMKQLGFNMMRKHCKLEPSRWYYHCDRLGMIVWQDMVNGGSAYHTWFVTWLPSICSWMKKHVRDHHEWLFARKQGKAQWVKECTQSIEHLRVFPCISTWVLFNEGWGQFDTVGNTNMVRQLDPTRLIDAASGWFDQGCGDIRSEHHYFDQPKMLKDPRAFVLSEYGGYACQLKNHSSVERVYGYHTYTTCEEFSKAYSKLMKETVEPLIEQGLCGAVYTQVSDIEEEVNGLLSYDREICKLENNDGC